jgi:hypothetical protein
MKAIQTKTQTRTPSATKDATQAGKTGPFFKKGPGQGFFKPANPGVQTRLNVGEPGDAYEKEADHAADRVVKGLPASAQAGLQPAGIHRKPIFESENDPAERGKVQKKGSIPGSGASKASDSGGSKAPVPGSSKASPAVESGIARSRGSGSPLPATTRNQMESSFGADFSGVRVHQDSGAQEMNKDLNAQAFTHGKDIYFNKGKFSPGSSDGKHLLAHELTHVVQQTGGETAGEKPVQQKAAVGGTPMPIQKADAAGGSGGTGAAGAGGTGAPSSGAATPVTSDLLAKYKVDAGEIVIGENGYNFILTNFALKHYPNVTGPEPKNPMKSSIVERNTKQGEVWEKAVVAEEKGLEESLERLTINGKGQPNPDKSQEYVLTVKGGTKSEKSQIVGTVATFTKLLKVPFWDKSGNPVLHQIEHIIDWQIMGDEADNLTNNLILLDAKTNGKEGQVVKKKIKEAKNKILTSYRKDTSIPEDVYSRAAASPVVYKDAKKDARDVDAKSTITLSELTAKSDNKIINDKIVELRIQEIPKGSCVIYTAFSNVGYVMPYKHQSKKVKIDGDATKKTLDTITQLQLIYTKSKVVKGGEKERKLEFETLPTPNHFKLKNDEYATSLTNQLKLVGMSPIKFDDNVEVSPLTGIAAEGKVISDIPFLKDADIGFSMEGGDFSVSAKITSDVLKGKLPKPLDVDYTSLTITASTEEALAVEGDIGFSIKNVGKGILSGKAGTGGFGLAGKFTFDNSKSFKKAEISFSYSRQSGEGEGKWEGAGELAFEKDVIPGVKSGDIKIGYANNVLSGAGSFETTLPKMDKVEVTAQFDSAGNFSITGKTGLKGVPGIKSSEITVTVTRQDSDYSLAMAGTAVPDLPNIPGLGATLTVSYNKGVFTLQGTATYQKDKLDGSLTVGVTNAVVDENGAPSKDAEDGKLKIFGNGSITLHLLKGVDATLQGAVDANGEMYIWGKMDVTATPFDPVDIDKKIFEVSTSIPLVGIPFASINLDLSSSASFHFHWDPLTIHLEATLDRTNIKEIGKAGGELTASLSSQAEAGFMFKIGAGVSLSVAIIKLGAHINGAVDLGLKAEVGAEAKAKWDMQKGLQLEEAEAHLSGVPTVAFILSGDITADVDLWLTSYNVYKKEMTFAKKTLDLSQFAFGLSIPLKIDENGKIQGIDYSKLKLQPELGKDAGDKLSDQVLNGDDKKKKEQKEREAKDKIRSKVVEKLRAKKADGETNLRGYASDLKDEIMDDTPDELQGMVDQVIEEELRKMEEEQATAAAAAAAAAQNPPNPNPGEPSPAASPMTI